MAYTETEAKRLVIEAGHRLVSAGLIARTWGNISARISDTQFVITPSGMAYDELTPELIVTVNIDDCSYEGSVKPSSEKGIHAESYKYRKDVNFVIHTHQLYATAYGTLGTELPTAEKLLGGTVPCAEYAISSTKMLKNKVSESIRTHLRSNAFFMRYHGVLCLGADIENAFDIAMRLEELCENEVKAKLGELPCGEDTVLPESFKGSIEEPCALFTSTPAVFAAAKKWRRLYPMIDDMAQIGGTDFCSVKLSGQFADKAAKALCGRNVVMVAGKGAVCTGKSMDECQAVANVLEKNCLAKLYSDACGKRHKLNYFDALLQRKIYIMKYSKIKNG